MTGRITAADANYPYGSAKNESTPGAGDGTPYFKARADDIFGMQQAILRAAGIVPTGNAETALSSQYLSGIVQQAQGRASLYDDTGAANAYVVALRTNQQAPGAVFEGQRFRFVADNTNTGASTVDISLLLGQSAGSTVVNIKLKGGATDPGAGIIVAGDEVEFVYRTSPGAHAQVEAEFTQVNLAKLESLGSQSTKMNSKTVDTGVWNMDSNTAGFTGLLAVPHGLADFTKIKGLTVIIRNDSGTVYYDFLGYGQISFNSSSINLFRTPQELFDSTDFKSTSFDRGSILINYSS